MGSQFGGIPIDDSVSNFGGIPVTNTQTAPLPQSVPALGGAFPGVMGLYRGLGEGLSAPVKTVVDRFANPPSYDYNPDDLKSQPTAIANHPVVKLATQMHEQIKNRDMEGLTRNIGRLAGQAIFAFMAPEAAQGILELPGAISDLAENAAPVKAGLQAAAKTYAKEQVYNIPVVGKPLKAAVEAYSKASQAPKPTNAAPASAPEPYQPRPVTLSTDNQALAPAAPTAPIAAPEPAAPAVTSEPAVEAPAPEKSIAQQLKDLIQPDEPVAKDSKGYWPTPQEIGMNEPYPAGKGAVERHYISAYNKGANAAHFVLDNDSGAEPITDPNVFDLPAAKTQDFIDAAWEHGLKNGHPIPGHYDTPLGGDSLRFAKAYLQHLTNAPITDSTVADTVK